MTLKQLKKKYMAEGFKLGIKQARRKHLRERFEDYIDGGLGDNASDDQWQEVYQNVAYTLYQGLVEYTLDRLGFNDDPDAPEVYAPEDELCYYVESRNLEPIDLNKIFVGLKFSEKFLDYCPLNRRMREDILSIPKNILNDMLKEAKTKVYIMCFDSESNGNVVKSYPQSMAPDSL